MTVEIYYNLKYIIVYIQIYAFYESAPVSLLKQHEYRDKRFDLHERR